MSQATPGLPVLTPPTLDEHFTRFPANSLDCLCADEHLVLLSGAIADWRDLSPFLHLTPAEEKEIENVVPVRSPSRQCIDALRKWREKMGQRATHRLLVETLHQAKRADLIDELCTVLTSSNTTLTPPSTQNVETSKTQWYGSYLKDRYKDRAVKVFAQWPPSPTEKIFNLAIIKKEKIQRGKIDDEFVRLTITGKVDDILQKKSPVKLEKIFESIRSKRKVVLIEGSPGAGKSTLSLDICERWGEGELFQEYQMIILVRLRDPLVQQAKSIKELLPYLEPTERKELAAAIAANKGRGVLWVLDGWDEIPSNMSKGSILHKLIQPDTPLYESSVIVTSRPIASADLHRLVSLRIEIVGFTPEERILYFKESLKGDKEALETLLAQIQENPVVEGSCYLPLNAAIIVHLFLAGDGLLPTTVSGIFTSVVNSCLSRYLHERLGQKQTIPSDVGFEKLPRQLRVILKKLSCFAFSGVIKDKVTFSSSDLKSVGATAEVCKVGLLQATISIVSQGQSVYYSFLHLSIQELLAAVHISDMPASEQISTFQNLFGQSRFSAVFQFYAGITKLSSRRPFLSFIPTFLRPSIPAGILDIVSSIIDKKSEPLLVSLLHCLYEAQDQSLCQFVAEQLGGGLYLNTTTLTPVDCLAIGYFLSNVCITTHGVFAVLLYGCSIDDQCCKFLMRGLCKCVDSNNAVTAYLDIYLWDNNISSDGAHHIANVLHNIDIVHRLRLGDQLGIVCGNPICCDGVKFISEALITNSSLVVLDLRNCSVEITEENGPVLCEMLKQNKTLTYLDFSRNISVSDTGVKFISSGLKHNTTLRVLVLIYCHITDQGVESIAECLTENKTLKKLYLYGNDNITDKGLSLLTNALIANTSLESLSIPWHLRSSRADIEKTINETRKRSGLPTIAVDDSSSSCASLQLDSQYIQMTRNWTHHAHTMSYNHTQ